MTIILLQVLRALCISGAVWALIQTSPGYRGNHDAR